MKKLFLFLIIIFASFSNLVAQTFKAKVERMNGLELYVLAEPETEYEKLGTVQIVSTGFEKNTIQAMVSRLVVKASKTHPQADAIIYYSGNTAFAIKFKEKSNGIAVLNNSDNLDDKPIFVYSEPIDLDYNVVDMKKLPSQSLTPKIYYIYGVFNNVSKKVAKKQEHDGLIYTGGNKVKVITL
ncbi:hypothetical protein [Aureibacter tunicatorum]|uniref:Uncharacterized protein n=1 Tax=Aureibacter tunicatorum TaxID=866807 RepID=A0AAE3XQ77_9BACT|nr:hypothetical protein [Aureibacter tunicatorum]MDR6239926.1 hypothetical protein [Aureibacter tunicatorum]BDD04401.1 hypothetical protein AUTU_18840 [Aureibacter tunicatorum]